MREPVFYLIIIASIFIHSCNNTVNSYKNDLGINPATIAQMDTVNYTTIEWEDTLSNFGTVKEGDSVFVKFRFKNSGDKALFVSAVHSSCGCAAVSYSQDAVLPGKKGEVTARFKNKYQPGPVHQTIIVTTNTVNKINHVLSFIGQVADSSGMGN
jgi:hypothetical protein